jgi:heme-degrading monooxygenase HmoA/catechol 2,3-dioxygenase-like lactoylglutathione lyase family enzyme
LNAPQFSYAWEYEVPPEAEPEFLASYAPDGAWARLFRRAPGYVRTELLRDRRQPGRYLTVDYWRDEGAFQGFRREFAAEFDALDRSCSALTRREIHLGDFEPVGEEPAVEVECIVPILRVRHLRESLRYYVDVLGFRPEWGTEEGSEMASVIRDGRSIMLCQGAQGQPGTWVWIGVEDIRPLYTRLTSTGAKIRQGPVSRPWAYEMQVEDPDGHVLRFGSEPLPGP